MDTRLAAPRDRAGKTLSLVIPMHNEGPGLQSLFQRLDQALGPLGVEIELVCVDDGSQDDTLDVLTARAAVDRRIRILGLSRNFGKEAALTAGLDIARGDVVVPIDADLQDPPELIEEFLALWEQGYDVVYGVRTDRSSDTHGKRLSAGAFYSIFNMLSDRPIPASTGDFRLMDRTVVEAVKRLPERNRFMKGLFSWVGFRQVGVPYVRPQRTEGETSWNYVRLWRFALDGLTAFSTLPLRIWTGIGLSAAIAAMVFAISIVVRVLLVGREVPGYASLMVVTLLGIAAQLIAIGVLGEYVGRMYGEVKGRPIYLVRDRIGFDGD